MSKPRSSRIRRPIARRSMRPLSRDFLDCVISVDIIYFYSDYVDAYNMKTTRTNLAQEARFAKSLCRDLPKSALRALEALIRQHNISMISGDVIYLRNGWYITHSGLLRIARRQ